MTDIARAAGVSQAAVSYVLNGRAREKRISAATQQKVEAACRQLGYRRNYLATAMLTKRTQTIGVLFTNALGEFMGRILNGVQEVLRRYNRHVVVSTCENSPALEAHDLDMLEYRHVDGVISFPVWTERPPAHWRDFLRSGRPTIFIDRTPPGVAGDCVRIDDFQAGAEAADRLRREGATCLVLVRPAHDRAATTVAREKGFLAGAGAPAIIAADDLPAIRTALADRDDRPGFFTPVSVYLVRALQELFSAESAIGAHARFASVGYCPEPFFVRNPWWMAEQPENEMGQLAAQAILHKLGEPIGWPDSLVVAHRWKLNRTGAAPP